MTGDAAKRYGELKRKYKLPDFSLLDEFEAWCIEETECLLAEIRRRIFDRLHDATEFLAEVLQPDTNLTSLYESRVFNDDEKKDVYELYRRLMFWRRDSFMAAVDSSDAANSAFISGFVAEWKSLKPRLMRVIEKVRDSWELGPEEQEKLGYFG